MKEAWRWTVLETGSASHRVTKVEACRCYPSTVRSRINFMSRHISTRLIILGRVLLELDMGLPVLIHDSGLLRSGL
jgi:hypothetical protein